MILMSILGFLSTPDIVVWPEAPWPLHCGSYPRWPPFVQGQIFDLHHF